MFVRGLSFKISIHRYLLMTENQKTIKKIMIDMEVNQSELARRSEVTPQFLGQLLHGERKSRRIKGRVARILKISEAEMTVLIGP